MRTSAGSISSASSIVARGVSALVATVLLLASLPAPLTAQVLGGRERSAATATLIPGEPFGVGQVTIPINGVTPVDPELFSISDREGRIFYPAFSTGGAVRQLLGGLLGGENLPPRETTVYFLFTGNEPIDLTLHAPAPIPLTVRPIDAAAAGEGDAAAGELPIPGAPAIAGPEAPRDRGGLFARRRAEKDASRAANGLGRAGEVGATPANADALADRLLRQWWREYFTASQSRAGEGDYPPLVETYLTSMLASRLGLESPLFARDTFADRTTHEGLKTLELIAGTESLRMRTLRETMLGQSDLGQAADQPIPEDVLWQAGTPFAAPENVVVESMARMVPPECFYVRFGRFSNYLWLNRLTRDYGGDLANMVTGRGIEQGMNAAIERQLAVRYNELSELLGDTVVADMAVIGRDTFLQDGAAIGLLFEAKNPLLLTASLTQERAAVLAREKEAGCTEQTVTIAGRKVSFLSTPDNRVRSFLASHENFRFATSSLAMVERFYAMADGETSLGQTDEFRAARAAMPVERDDTIFIYLSSAFFRGLVSPQYQIELQRRMKSVADIELFHMARLAAKHEGRRHETIDELIAGGLLPQGFGRRPDGSGPIVAGESVIDSRRGARGSFLPIPDVELTSVTREESAEYFARSDFYRNDWRQMDPLMIGIRRFAVDKDGRERLVIDANTAPLANEDKYGFLLSMLGPPTAEMITPAPGDIIHVQASIRGGLLFPSVPQHYLFAGVQDIPPQFDPKGGGLLKTLRMLQATPGYIGAWPKPGFIDWLPLGLAGQPDAAGFSQLPFGLWRRQFGAFSVLSFQQPVLAHATRFIEPVPAESPAQIRVYVGDLGASQLAGWANMMLRERAADASDGNTRLLHTLTQQLGVPGEEALAVAEELLDARLVCPLGGEYEPAKLDGGAIVWRSTAYRANADGVRLVDTYRAPLLDWFRGVNADVTKDADRLLVHAELDMQRKPTDPTPIPALPFIDLFGGGKKDGGAKETNGARKAETPKPAADAANRPGDVRSTPPGKDGEVKPRDF